MSKAKAIGSAKSRKAVKSITRRVLAKVKDLTPTQAAPVLGVSVDDMRNMRQGNQVSSQIFFKMVRVGRFTPQSIIEPSKQGLRKMPKTKSTKGSAPSQIFARVRKIARETPGKELAKKTGLSVTGAYGLRYNTGIVTLYTLLGLLDAGIPMNRLFFGARA